ncbi:MAG: HAD family hydrolase [Clostridia bacterium]|nr:HAD family hydrolase [Clostridia bacterium]
MYNKTKYFIFDLDGTLAYTLDDLTDSMNYMLSTLGYPTIDTARALSSINSGSRKFVQRCLPPDVSLNENAVDRAFSVYFDYYAGHYLVKTRLYPGVAEGISLLKRNGCKIAVYSNKDDLQVKKIINALFPAETFDVILGFTGEFPHKPDPAGALYVAKRLGAERPAEVTVIGDSDMDMLLARNAGMQPVGVSWGYRPVELLKELGAEMILQSEESFMFLI